MHPRSMGELPIPLLYDTAQMFPEVYDGPVCFSFDEVPICIDIIPADDGVMRMAVMLRVDGDPPPKDEI